MSGSQRDFHPFMHLHKTLIITALGLFFFGGAWGQVGAPNGDIEDVESARQLAREGLFSQARDQLTRQLEDLDSGSTPEEQIALARTIATLGDLGGGTKRNC